MLIRLFSVTVTIINFLLLILLSSSLLTFVTADVVCKNAASFRECTINSNNNDKELVIDDFQQTYDGSPMYLSITVNTDNAAITVTNSKFQVFFLYATSFPKNDGVVYGLTMKFENITCSPPISTQPICTQILHPVSNLSLEVINVALSGVSLSSKPSWPSKEPALIWFKEKVVDSRLISLSHSKYGMLLDTDMSDISNTLSVSLIQFNADVQNVEKIVVSNNCVVTLAANFGDPQTKPIKGGIQLFMIWFRGKTPEIRKITVKDSSIIWIGGTSGDTTGNKQDAMLHLVHFDHYLNISNDYKTVSNIKLKNNDIAVTSNAVWKFPNYLYASIVYMRGFSNLFTFEVTGNTVSIGKSFVNDVRGERGSVNASIVNCQGGGGVYSNGPGVGDMIFRKNRLEITGKYLQVVVLETKGKESILNSNRNYVYANVIDMGTDFLSEQEETKTLQIEENILDLSNLHCKYIDTTILRFGGYFHNIRANYFTSNQLIATPVYTSHITCYAFIFKLGVAKSLFLDFQNNSVNIDAKYVLGETFSHDSVIFVFFIWFERVPRARSRDRMLKDISAIVSQGDSMTISSNVSFAWINGIWNSLPIEDVSMFVVSRFYYNVSNVYCYYENSEDNQVDFVNLGNEVAFPGGLKQFKIEYCNVVGELFGFPSLTILGMGSMYNFGPNSVLQVQNNNISLTLNPNPYEKHKLYRAGGRIYASLFRIAGSYAGNTLCDFLIDNNNITLDLNADSSMHFAVVSHASFSTYSTKWTFNSFTFSNNKISGAVSTEENFDPKKPSQKLNLRILNIPLVNISQLVQIANNNVEFRVVTCPSHSEWITVEFIHIVEITQFLRHLSISGNLFSIQDLNADGYNIAQGVGESGYGIVVNYLMLERKFEQYSVDMSKQAGGRMWTLDVDNKKVLVVVPSHSSFIIANETFLIGKIWDVTHARVTFLNFTAVSGELDCSSTKFQVENISFSCETRIQVQRTFEYRHFFIGQTVQFYTISLEKFFAFFNSLRMTDFGGLVKGLDVDPSVNYVTSLVDDVDISDWFWHIKSFYTQGKIDFVFLLDFATKPGISSAITTVSNSLSLKVRNITAVISKSYGGYSNAGMISFAHFGNNMCNNSKGEKTLSLSELNLFIGQAGTAFQGKHGSVVFVTFMDLIGSYVFAMSKSRIYGIDLSRTGKNEEQKHSPNGLDTSTIVLVRQTGFVMTERPDFWLFVDNCSIENIVVNHHIVVGIVNLASCRSGPYVSIFVTNNVIRNISTTTKMAIWSSLMLFSLSNQEQDERFAEQHCKMEVTGNVVDSSFVSSSSNNNNNNNNNNLFNMNRWCAAESAQCSILRIRTMHPFLYGSIELKENVIRSPSSTAPANNNKEQDFTISLFKAQFQVFKVIDETARNNLFDTTISFTKNAVYPINNKNFTILTMDSGLTVNGATMEFDCNEWSKDAQEKFNKSFWEGCYQKKSFVRVCSEYPKEVATKTLNQSISLLANSSSLSESSSLSVSSSSSPFSKTKTFFHSPPPSITTSKTKSRATKSLSHEDHLLSNTKSAQTSSSTETISNSNENSNENNNNLPTNSLSVSSSAATQTAPLPVPPALQLELFEGANAVLSAASMAASLPGAYQMSKKVMLGAKLLNCEDDVEQQQQQSTSEEEENNNNSTDSSSSSSWSSTKITPALSQAERLEDLSTDSNPLGITISSPIHSNYNTYLGALIGNPLFTLLFFIALLLVTFMISKSRDVSFDTATRATSTPGWMNVPGSIFSAATAQPIGVILTSPGNMKSMTGLLLVVVGILTLIVLPIGVAGWCAYQCMNYEQLTEIKVIDGSDPAAKKKALKEQQAKRKKKKKNTKNKKNKKNSNDNLRQQQQQDSDDSNDSDDSSDSDNENNNNNNNQRSKNKNKNKNEEEGKKSSSSTTSLRKIPMTTTIMFSDSDSSCHLRLLRYLAHPWKEWTASNFVKQWGPFFDPYENCYYVLLDLGVPILIGLASGIATSCQRQSCCQGIAVFNMIISAIHFFCLCWIRPFMMRLDVVFGVLTTTATFVQCSVVAAALIGSSKMVKVVEIISIGTNSAGLAMVFFAFLQYGPKARKLTKKCCGFKKLSAKEQEQMLLEDEDENEDGTSSKKRKKRIVKKKKNSNNDNNKRSENNLSRMMLEEEEEEENNNNNNNQILYENYDVDNSNQRKVGRGSKNQKNEEQEDQEEELAPLQTSKKKVITKKKKSSSSYVGNRERNAASSGEGEIQNINNNNNKNNINSNNFAVALDVDEYSQQQQLQENDTVAAAQELLFSPKSKESSSRSASQQQQQQQQQQVPSSQQEQEQEKHETSTSKTTNPNIIIAGEDDNDDEEEEGEYYEDDGEEIYHEDFTGEELYRLLGGTGDEEEQF